MTGLAAQAEALIVVAGPTASGKSALALRVAEAFDGEIVNADSMQVYRELRVLTARPDAAEEARVPHHLYGVMSVAEVCSAGAWLRMAERAIAEIRARGRLAIVCGGTGLYLKVLAEGIAEVPDVPADIVEEARRLHDAEGGEGFRARLAALDPGAAERLAAGDRQR
ncbi:MAG: isopentenyl transferase family protein, partial [Rhodospirillaceae bacterium]